MKRMLLACLAGSALIATTGPSLAWSQGAFSVRSKYPRDVQPLSKSNDYVRRSASPDFWALMPFLTSQTTNSACSLAAATLVLNGARRDQDLGNEEPLLTPEAVLKRTGDSDWAKATKEDGGGISIDEFERVFRKAVRAHGFTKARVTRVTIEAETDEGLHTLMADLEENEMTANNFIVLNFDQGALMEDESVGHFAVVGAYDRISERVLILDSDKEWYEPYWAPVTKLFSAMRDTRGYIKLKIQPGAPNIQNDVQTRTP